MIDFWCKILLFWLISLPLLLPAQLPGPITLETASQWEVLADSLAQTTALDSAIQIRQQLQVVYRASESWESFAAGGLSLATYFFQGGRFDVMMTPLDEVLEEAAPHLEEPSEKLANVHQTKAEVFHYVFGNWDSSLVYMNSAISIFEALDQSEPLISCSLLNASNCVYLTRWQDILPNLERANSQMQQSALSKKDAQWGELYNLYGIAYRNLEKNEEALNYQGLTIEYTEDPAIFAVYLNNLADLYQDRADWTRAIQYYERALDMLQNNSEANPSDIQNVLNNLCTAWLRKGDPRKAIENGIKNLEFLEQLQSTKRLIDGSNNLALAYLEANQPDNALQILKEAEALHQSEAYHQEFTWHNLSLAYRTLGRYEDAIRYMQQSISAYEEKGRADHPLMAKKFRHLGTVFAKQGDFEKALTYYEEAFRLPKGNISNLDSLKLLRDKGLTLIELSGDDPSLLFAALENHLLSIDLADRLRQVHQGGSASLFERDTFPLYLRSADVAYMHYQTDQNTAGLQALFHISECKRLAQSEEAAIAALRSQIALLPDSLQAQINDLEIGIQFYQEQLRRAQGDENADQDKLRDWQTTLESLTSERLQLIDQIPSSALAETEPQKRRPIKTLAALQANLAPNMLLANFIEGEHHNYLLGVHANKVVVEQLGKNSSSANGIAQLLAKASDLEVQTLVVLAPEMPEGSTVSEVLPTANIMSFEQSNLRGWLDGGE